MCGAHSALGLEDRERVWWPHLRDRLREPGRLMALMRGVLGSDAEVAVVAAVSPRGVAQPLALLVTPAIAEEITLDDDAGEGDLRTARIGDYPVQVLVDPDATGTPIAVLVSPWIFENLSLFARKLWSRR